MDRKSVYVFYGEDHYSAQSRLQYWRSEFEKKYGDLNTHIFDGESFTASQFHEVVQTVPFLSEKKLLIIRDFLVSGSDLEQKKISAKLEQIPDYMVCIFLDFKHPDARTVLWKKVSKIGHLVEFPILTKVQLITWIQQKSKQKKLDLALSHIEILAETVGSDLWQMSQEIEKIDLFHQTQKVDNKTLELLVSQNFTASIFKLTDSVGQKNLDMSLATLQKLFQSGEDVLQIFFMLVRHFRILILVKTCVLEGLSNAEIVRKTKEHSFVVNNAVLQSRNFDIPSLQKIYSIFLQIDIALKNGTIKLTTHDQQELRFTLERFIIDLCIKK